MKKSNHVSRYGYDEEDWFTNKRQKAERPKRSKKRMDRALRVRDIEAIVKECID
jgi:hypothetical protein